VYIKQEEGKTGNDVPAAQRDWGVAGDGKTSVQSDGQLTILALFFHGLRERTRDYNVSQIYSGYGMDVLVRYFMEDPVGA
jgi:hypothetical protein